MSRDQCPETRDINVAMVTRDPEIRDQDPETRSGGPVRDVVVRGPGAGVRAGTRGISVFVVTGFADLGPR